MGTGAAIDRIPPDVLQKENAPDAAMKLLKNVSQGPQHVFTTG
jgi:hypothetical protein